MLNFKIKKFKVVVQTSNHTLVYDAELRGGSCYCTVYSDVAELLPGGKIGMAADYVKIWKPYDDASLKYFKGE